MSVQMTARSVTKNVTTPSDLTTVLVGTDIFWTMMVTHAMASKHFIRTLRFLFAKSPNDVDKTSTHPVYVLTINQVILTINRMYCSLCPLPQVSIVKVRQLKTICKHVYHNWYWHHLKCETEDLVNTSNLCCVACLPIRLI